MSALAQILADLGHEVQGSDVETRYFTQTRLEQRQIRLLPFDRGNIRDGLTVIASNAFKDHHVEIAESLRRGMPFYRYHDFVGELISSFTSIAVTGTHGKTTTTGWLSHVFGSIRPASCLIGDGTGKGVPGSRYFIFESCEYRRHFLAYRPDYAVITNIEFDHPDYYSGIEDVADAFRSMASRVGRCLIACGDDPQIRRLETGKPTLYYGFASHNDLRAGNVRIAEHGTRVDVVYRDSPLGTFTLPLHGRHNVLNALAVIGVCLLEDLNMEEVRGHLQTFPGVRRRFSEKSVGGRILIDDYAHHPTEIRAVFDAVRSKYPGRRIVGVFQPHTFSRLSQFLDEFAESLSLADQVYLCDVFGSAREAAGSLGIEALLERIPSSRHLRENNIGQLADDPDSVLLFMGAGDIQKYQDWLEEMIRQGETAGSPLP